LVAYSHAHVYSLSTGVGVSMTGEWREAPTGKRQTHELVANEVQIAGEHDAPVGTNLRQLWFVNGAILRFTVISHPEEIPYS
jgi:hypothetical protein